MTTNVIMEPISASPIFSASQNDIGRNIKVSLINADGTAFIIPSGATVTLQGTKPSGLGFTLPGVVNGSKVTFTTDEDSTSEAARIECEIVVTTEASRIGSANCILKVEKNPHPDDVTDGSPAPLVDEITALVERAELANESAVRAEYMALNAEETSVAAAVSAAADADRAEHAADRAENIDGIVISADIVWESGGINTGGNLNDDLTTRTDRCRTGAAYQDITTVKIQATTETTVYIKYYRENGTPIRVDTKTANQTEKVISIDAAAKYIRVSAIASSVEDVEERGLKVALRQNLLGVEASIIENAERMKLLEPTPEVYHIGSLNQIARLGWHPTEPGYPPQQSIASYMEAYLHKCRMMLADVRITADGEYVCWHDPDLSSGNIRHTDGSNLTAEEKAQLIENLTLEELDVYDFGIFKGQEYAGTKILRLKDFLSFCAEMNVYAVLEMKVRWTPSQIEELSSLIKQYKLHERTVIAAYYNDLDTPTTGETEPGYTFWLQYLPKGIMLVLSAQTAWSRSITIAKATAEEGMRSYVGHLKPAELTASQISEARSNDIGFFYGEITTASQMDEFYSAGYCDLYDFINSGWVGVYDYVYEKRRA